MKFKTVKVGNLRTNCYIIFDEHNGEGVIVDPGDEAAKILPEIAELKVRYIIITHGHPDHFGALDELKKKTGAPLLMNSGDNWFFNPDRTIKEGDEISFGRVTLKVLQTPGHSRGGVCLYAPGYLFSGDTLFAGTCGRTDLPGGSAEAMAKSLKKLAQLPGETMVFPGHDEFTTIQQEKERGTLG
ncbi:MAG: MBL fold metallo-hydrolase [Candidatus Margulisbacteria bacterium]|nr:MBL fold metallo-hydrolase [Candidatus Margulisiibacteriota bacterium]